MVLSSFFVHWVMMNLKIVPNWQVVNSLQRLQHIQKIKDRPALAHWNRCCSCKVHVLFCTLRKGHFIPSLSAKKVQALGGADVPILLLISATPMHGFIRVARPTTLQNVAGGWAKALCPGESLISSRVLRRSSVRRLSGH